MAKLTGRVAWVSGAASGIGRATAVLLAAEGARVSCLDRDADGCRAAAEAIVAAGGQATAWPLDVRDESGWDDVVQQTRRLGGLDVAVHAAGISLVGDVTDVTLADWRKLMAVNLDGVFLGTRAAL